MINKEENYIKKDIQKIEYIKVKLQQAYYQIGFYGDNHFLFNKFKISLILKLIFYN